MTEKASEPTLFQQQPFSINHIYEDFMNKNWPRFSFLQPPWLCDSGTRKHLSFQCCIIESMRCFTLPIFKNPFSILPLSCIDLNAFSTAAGRPDESLNVIGLPVGCVRCVTEIGFLLSAGKRVPVGRTRKAPAIGSNRDATVTRYRNACSLSHKQTVQCT